MKFGVQRFCSIVAMSALLFISAGCASAPVQEMSNARQAIAAAVDAGAEDHAPGELEAARKLLADAESSLHDKRYREARRAAMAAKTKAVAALEATPD